MFDPAQILLFLVILVLTILLVVLGIQVSLILRDVRKTVSKANKVLDNTGEITKSISAPVSSLSSIIMGIRSGGAIAGIVKKVHESVREEPDGKQ